jgi:cell wall-associated NlpC family hydrolase
MTREEIVAAARSYVGTPFHHQGRLKGVGIDCAGLLIGVARDLGLPHQDVRDYPDIPDGRRIAALVESQMTRVDDPEPGDAVLFWMETQTRHPQHLGILTPLLGGLGLVHAYFPVRRTVEVSFTQEWRNRAVGYFRFPGIV